MKSIIFKIELRRIESYKMINLSEHYEIRYISPNFDDEEYLVRRTDFKETNQFIKHELNGSTKI